MIDVYFNDVPYEIIRDEKGNVIAEVFLIRRVRKCSKKSKKN